MRRPSLLNTVFPLAAFVAGVMVGKYLPLDFLPGPQPGEEREAPPPDEMLSDLGREFGDLLRRSSGDEPGAAPSESPGEAQPPRTSDAAEARAFVERPVLVVAVREADTFVVQNVHGARHLLQLADVPSGSAQLARELQRFIGFYLAVELAEPPMNDQGHLVGTAYVQPRGWQPGQTVTTANERNLNVTIQRALSH